MNLKRHLGAGLKSKRNGMVFASAVIIGLTLLVAGTGKLPGQAEFMWAMLKSFWTPSVAYFISYLLPWVEISLGISLLLGIFPRIAASVFIPVVGAFMANNAWAVSQGMEAFQTCGSCFGVWEDLLGSLSPLGALIFDIVLLGLALVVLILHEEGFLTFRPWFIRQKGEKSI